MYDITIKDLEQLLSQMKEDESAKTQEPTVQVRRIDYIGISTFRAVLLGFASAQAAIDAGVAPQTITKMQSRVIMPDGTEYPWRDLPAGKEIPHIKA